MAKGATRTKTGLLDNGGLSINPATEEKQDEILAKLNDSIDVKIQDQSTEIIDLKLSRKLDDLTLLADTAIDDMTITVETTSEVPTTEMTICLKEGTAFYQARPVTVTSLGGNQYSLVMDTPLDFAFTTTGVCELTSTNLAVDGSVTPVVFRATPSGLDDGVQWDINRFILLWGGEGVTTSDPAPDDGDFGVTGALTKGVYIRSRDGIVKNIFNAKTNGDFRARAYDVTYQPASKNGVYTVTVHREFNGQENNGVVIRLSAITNDEFELVVQDDLTGMTGGQMVVQGQVVDN